MESANISVSLSRAELTQARENRAMDEAETGLFALIKKSSRYNGQDNGKHWPCALYSDGEYIVHGNGNRYRLSDVDLFWSNGVNFFKVKK